MFINRIIMGMRTLLIITTISSMIFFDGSTLNLNEGSNQILKKIRSLREKAKNELTTLTNNEERYLIQKIIIEEDVKYLESNRTKRYAPTNVIKSVKLTRTSSQVTKEYETHQRKHSKHPKQQHRQKSAVQQEFVIHRIRHRYEKLRRIRDRQLRKIQRTKTRHTHQKSVE
ncbi:hypothetical protein DICVIV_03177 [Dictyocaulus viviparus]|uniref:Uncharacterized protein n=1 Tax=Dictyocaulus viviparus TaxID=29172 RepID=A0A0D8Y398_DICVI|nr:hypothetical protein DICVIV_03177 [Dictyocaulus viviparus]